MRVLVFGLGKSGTTVIAKTIQHSRPGFDFLMEPKSEERLRERETPNQVVKILYNHWQTKLSTLTKVLRNESSVCFDRLVKIIRDPRDQAISSFLYGFYEMARAGRISPAQLCEVVELLRAKEKSPAAISFAHLCAEVNRILNWEEYSLKWLFANSDLVANRAYWDYLVMFREVGYLISYEAFIQGDLAGIGNYLDLRLSPRRDVGQYARTLRTGSSGGWREFFTPEDLQLLRPMIGKLLAEMGYNDWELRPAAELNPEHYSRYVVRLMREAQA